jgi:hypothetical protein
MLSRQYVGIYQILLVKRSLVEKGEEHLHQHPLKLPDSALVSLPAETALEIADIVRCARSKCAGCGILGFGNKGAVSISVIVHSDTICFTCSHLAAGQSQVDRRNNDAEEIRRSTIFKPAVEQTQGLDRSGRQGSDANLAPRDVTDIKKQEEMVKEAVKLYSIAAVSQSALFCNLYTCARREFCFPSFFSNGGFLPNRRRTTHRVSSKSTTFNSFSVT